MSDLVIGQTLIPWSEWKGAVEHYGTFYRTLDEFVEAHLDECDSDTWDPEPYVKPCDTWFPQIDINQAMAKALCQDEIHEEAAFVDVDELREFIKAWNAKQTYESWVPRSREVIDFTGFPWAEHCGTGETWDAVRKAILGEAQGV